MGSHGEWGTIGIRGPWGVEDHREWGTTESGGAQGVGEAQGMEKHREWRSRESGRSTESRETERRCVALKNGELGFAMRKSQVTEQHQAPRTQRG